jgi:uncharacterized membrane protein YeiH
MDIFGISFLGITTGVGGGIIRDLIVGITPPLTFRDPVYLLISLTVSIIVFLPPIRRWIFSDSVLYDKLMLLMDSIGLGVFTVSGIQTAYMSTNIHGIVLLSFVGVVTGVGGGLLRDTMAGEKPYIFVKHFYASASLIGAIVCILLWKPLGRGTAMLAGCILIVLLRLLAARFRWSLPKADINEFTDFGDIEAYLEYDEYIEFRKKKKRAEKAAREAARDAAQKAVR